MNTDYAAKQLAELGHATRLSIFRIMVRAGRSGLPVSDIQSKLDIPGSTLSHHISRLARVGLLKQEREGRVLRCTAQIGELESLIAFLMEECCVNE